MMPTDRCERTKRWIYIFSWRELRKVTKALTLHYERKLYWTAAGSADTHFRP